MGFSKCFSVLYKKHMVYMEKKRTFRPIIETKLQFLHGFYGGIFSKIFCAVLTKIKVVSIFVSIPHCPMDYCIPLYSNAFCCCFFLLVNALLVIAWNNLDSKLGVLTKIETPFIFDSIGQSWKKIFLHINHVKKINFVPI